MKPATERSPWSTMSRSELGQAALERNPDRDDAGYAV